MSFSLLGAHVNNTLDEIPDVIQAWKPPLVVVLDHSQEWHGVKAATPNTLFVGRVWQDMEPNFNRPDLDPIAVAHDHCSRILALAERQGGTYSYWQGVNEPIILSAEAMRRYADFEAERARLMHGAGFRVVVGSFSVGTPELAYWHDFLPALEAARQYGGALALHEYAWPSLDHEWPWYLLRHRKVYQGEPDHNWQGLPAHLQTLPLLITECGLDGLLEQGTRPRGWRTQFADNPDPYLRQLAWYDAELQKDAYVVGAAIYCCGVGDWQWKPYDIWPEPAKTLARQATPTYRLLQPDLILPPAPPSPSPSPPEPATLEAMQAEVLARLDRIIRLLQEQV